MILQLAWRNIWRNKRRSLITAASVTFALFFAIIMRSFQTGTYDKVYENVINNSTGYIQIHAKGYWDEPTLDHSFELDDQLLKQVESSEGVRTAIPRLESFSLLSTGNDTKGALVFGIDPDLEEQNYHLGDRLIAGKFFEAHDRSIVLTEGMAKYLGVGIGDTVVMIGSGYQGLSANGKYPIVGIVKLTSPELNNRMSYLPIQEAQALFGAYGRATSLLVVPKVESEFQVVAEQLRTQIDTAATYEVMTWRDLMPELIQALEADSAGGLIILFILYLVIGFGVFGTILMLTAEREPEFGILISIGMKRQLISIITFLEVAFLGLIGIIMGLALALPITYYYHFYPIQLSGAMADSMLEYGFEPVMPMSINPDIPLAHGIGVLLLTIVLSTYAIWKIYQLNPVTAVKK